MKNLIYLFALILISCEPSEQEKQKQKMMDSVRVEQRKLSHQKDSIQKIVDLMERGLTERQAVETIATVDAETKQIDEDIKKKLK